MPGPIGRKLNEEWGVGAKHALFRRDGRWYHHLDRVPGALFDELGFVVFENELEYRQCPQLRHGKELHVDGGIKSIPGYTRVR